MRADLHADELSAWSCAALDRELLVPDLTIVRPTSRAVMLGAFQRAEEARGELATLPAVRRGSGGGAVVVDEGVLYVGLRLPSPRAIEADTARILNRAVRPVLRAVTRAAALTHYFGRDFLSSKRQPIASVSFGHDARTGHTLVETFLAITTVVQPERASFEGRVPTTLAALRGRAVDVDKLVACLVEEHAVAWHAPHVDGPPVLPDTAPWRARVDEAIGPLYAGHDMGGHVRLGGELIASRDRVAWLEERVQHAPIDDLDALVDEAFTGPDVALFGVKSLLSVRDVLRAALA